MVLPEHVRAVVDEYASHLTFADLAKSVNTLSEQYRAHRNTAAIPLSPEARTAAYLVSRLPATYAAVRAVLAETASRMPESRTPRTLLDLGAGTGAAALAAVETFGADIALTLVEPDKQLTRAGRQILPDATWLAHDLTRAPDLGVHDLVIASYTLSELPPNKRMAVVEKAWRACQGVLVILEPGSPAGFEIVRDIRQALLLDKSAHMVAPCPAETACPIPTGDWCHFAARVERSALHRRLKGATLSYEDEKFSYVVLARDIETPLPAGRIIRRPEHAPGLIQLQVCRPGALAAERVTKKDRDRFRAARKAAWGDSWE